MFYFVGLRSFLNQSKLRRGSRIFSTGYYVPHTFTVTATLKSGTAKRGTNKMNVNKAIDIIYNSERSPEEKRHLSRLVRLKNGITARFLGTPNFVKILEEFPLGKT